jgi:hypothetical protein
LPFLNTTLFCQLLGVPLDVTMVRKCVVPGCMHTDVSILAHRFPRRQENALLWQQALGLTRIPIQELVTRHVVCKKHFKTTDYRNAMSNSLNFTACPSLNIQLMDFEIVEAKDDETTFVGTPSPPPPPFIGIPRIPKDVVIRKTVVHNSPPAKKTKNLLVVTKEDKDDMDSIEVIEIPEEPNDEECEEVILVRPPERTHSYDRTGLPKTVLHLYPSVSSEVTIKRKRALTPEKKVTLYRNSSVQTDGEPTYEEIETKYSQYKDMTKLEVIKMLAERDDKIRELECKCNKLKQIIQDW